jgi:hypothetical protein
VTVRQIIGTRTTVSESAAAATWQNTTMDIAKAKARDILKFPHFVRSASLPGVRAFLFTGAAHR